MGQYYLGAVTPRKLTPAEDQLADRYFNYVEWFQFLLNQGFPRKLIPIIIAQIQLESGNFKGSFTTFNNYSGIRPSKNSPYQSGIYVTKGNGQFAKYASKEQWAKDFKRVISLNLGKKGRPIDAADNLDYMNRLKANNYFGSESVGSYAGKTNAWIKRNNEAYAWAHKFHSQMVKDGNSKGLLYYLKKNVMNPANYFDQAGLARSVYQAVKDNKNGVDNNPIIPSKGNWTADNAAVVKEVEKQSALKWKWDWDNWDKKQIFIASVYIVGGAIVLKRLVE